MRSNDSPQRIGRGRDSSSEHWPAPHTAPDGAPDVVLIVLDDVGFAQLGCFGSTIRTPNIDRIAREGLSYTNFHTTAVCSPTRASLLTGRHPHAVGFGNVTERLSGYPGYSMRLPDSAATIAEVLRRNGYSTRAVGKWHLTPSYETGPQGPYDRWPLGRGFQRFYGFLSGVADSFTPELTRDNSLIPQRTEACQDYHLSTDLVDESIGQIAELQALAPGLPYFLYLAFGAAHSPHQVPTEWIDRYRGTFDHGWDAERDRILQRQLEVGIVPPGTELGRSNPGVTPWQDLTATERQAYARMMEVYAAFLEHTDAQIGRLLDHLERAGTLDQTVIMLMSDNGASGEGGPQGLIDHAFDDIDLADSPAALAHVEELGGPDLSNHYPWGWAQAGNTPFRWYKQFTYAGGITNGLLVRWPAGGVPAGEIRRQYHHVVDVAPTLLDLAGIPAPDSVNGITQQPVHGTSMRDSFDQPEAESHRHTQHYEMFGNRGIYRDGWMAISRLHPMPERARPPVPETPALADLTWELYHHPTDPTENHDLAEEHPALLRELVDLWWAEAGRHQVLPVDDRPRPIRWPAHVPLPGGHDPDRTVFCGPGGPYERGGSARIAAVPFRLDADIVVPAVPAASAAGTGERPVQGVLFAMGGRHGGYCWYVRHGLLTFEVTRSALAYDLVAAPLQVDPGPHRLSVSLAAPETGNPVVTLELDGEVLGTGEIGGLIGRFPVHKARSQVGGAPDRTGSRAFTPPFSFSGELRRLVVRPGRVDPVDDIDAELAEQ